MIFVNILTYLVLERKNESDIIDIFLSIYPGLKDSLPHLDRKKDSRQSDYLGYKRVFSCEYHRCLQLFSLAFCSDRQCGDAYYPGDIRADGLCKGQSESPFHSLLSDYYGDDRDVCRLFRAGAVPAVTGCLALCPEPLPVYCLSYFPDDFLRPVHCLFQDSRECGIFYCDDRLLRIHRDGACARTEGVL